MGLGAALYALAALALLLRLFGGLYLSLRILRGSRPHGGEGPRDGSSGIGRRGFPRYRWSLAAGHAAAARLARGSGQTGCRAGTRTVAHSPARSPAVAVPFGDSPVAAVVSPLSWLLDRSLVRAAEQPAHDDAVAATGDRRLPMPRSAGIRTARRGPTEPAGVAMARYDRPASAIRRILHSTSRAARRHALGPGGRAWAGSADCLRGCGGLSAGGSQTGCAHAGRLVLLAAEGFVEQAPMVRAHSASETRARPGRDAVSWPSARATNECGGGRSSRLPVSGRSNRSNPAACALVGLEVHPGGRVTITTLPLETLITTAFGVLWQISGGKSG